KTCDRRARFRSAGWDEARPGAGPRRSASALSQMSSSANPDDPVIADATVVTGWSAYADHDTSSGIYLMERFSAFTLLPHFLTSSLNRASASACELTIGSKPSAVSFSCTVLLLTVSLIAPLSAAR